jgi:translation elongation factor EF-G
MALRGRAQSRTPGACRRRQDQPYRPGALRGWCHRHASAASTTAAQTDTLTLERQRGITIKAAVVSFRIGARCVDLIDTPGHPGFIAEVERTLDVLDSEVLVVSAVEGAQP